jgi:hypothetical protein
MQWNLGDMLPHEIAHANDWNRSKTMSLEERAELLHRVLERVQSADRYKSSYVESINNEDKQLELKEKVNEYWAEVASAYLRCDPNLNYKDIAIVHDLITKSDPNFDRQAMKNLRENLIQESVSTKTIAIDTN